MLARRARLSVFFLAVCIGLALGVVVLSHQNRELARVLAAELGWRDDGFERFAPGEIVPALALSAVDGTVEELAFAAGASPALLLFYAEACTTCPAAFAAWEELVTLVADQGLRVAAVQLDRTDASLPFGPRGIESFALADFTRIPVAKLSTVPLTLLVDGAGIVQWAHYGALTDVDREALVSSLPRDG